jgi:hypothetical protein
MFASAAYKALAVLFLAIGAQSTSLREPQYVTLPSLREQLVITDAWRSERIANIPNILKKYGVDAWLVRSTLFIIQVTLHYPLIHMKKIVV